MRRTVLFRTVFGILFPSLWIGFPGPLQAAAPAAASGAGGPILVEAIVFTSSGGPAPSVQGSAPAEDSGPTVWAGVDRIQLGDVTLSLGKEPLWNGQSMPPEGSGIQILSMPRLEVRPGAKAVVRSSSSPVQYLEAASADCYVLKTLPVEDGPGVRLEIQPSLRGARISSAVTATVRYVSRRQPIPGVDLDVGPPILSTRELRATVAAEPGTWLAVVARLGSATQEEAAYVLIVFRLTTAAS